MSNPEHIAWRCNTTHNWLVLTSLLHHGTKQTGYWVSDDINKASCRTMLPSDIRELFYPVLVEVTRTVTIVEKDKKPLDGNNQFNPVTPTKTGRS